MKVPAAVVTGVGAVALAVPPDASAYQFKVFEPSAVALNCVATAFWQ